MTLLIGPDHTIGQIIRWAYECHDNPGRTPPAAMFRLGARMSNGSGTASALDYSAEAGMVLKIVDHLPTRQIRALVQALYGMHKTAAVELADAISDTSGCHLHIAHCLIVAWVKKTSPSIPAMASDCGISRYQADREYHNALGVARGWDRMANEMLRVSFEGRGWIT